MQEKQSLAQGLILGVKSVVVHILSIGILICAEFV